MKLSEVIQENKERIAADWVEFAMENIPAARTIGETAARDHIIEMLDRMAQDMETPQTTRQQAQKAAGNKPAHQEHDQAAKIHGDQRVELGFSITEASSEFRALRASVLRVWDEKVKQSPDVAAIDEIMRFNEAIDEAWMHSIHSFHSRVEQSRAWLLGVLGHDLRTPLTAITGAAELLAESQNLSSVERELVLNTQSSIRRMNQLINNLLELTRVRLGSGLRIKVEHTDLKLLCKEIVQELQAAHPDAVIKVDAPGKVEGRWDSLRLSQVIENLISNALRHGEPGGPVSVALSAGGDRCYIKVHNEGPPIPPRVRKLMFQGMIKDTSKDPKPPGSVGLGLFIVNEVIEAHQGTVDVSSSKEEGTTFTVCLPRDSSNASDGG